jgi:hypothetical protein
VCLLARHLLIIIFNLLDLVNRYKFLKQEIILVRLESKIKSLSNLIIIRI